jgi:hypothetical protein
MNQNYTEFKFPQIKAHPWSKVRARIRSLASFPQQMKMGCAGIPIESTG